MTCNFYGVAGVPDTFELVTSHKSKSKSKSSKSRVESQTTLVTYMIRFNGLIATLCSNLEMKTESRKIEPNQRVFINIPHPQPP